MRHTNTVKFVTIVCTCVCVRVCRGQQGSACLAACHLLGQWAHWSPGSCRCGLVSVWQHTGHTTGLPHSWQLCPQCSVHARVFVYMCVCFGKCVTVLFPLGSYTQLLHTLPKHREYAPKRKQVQLSSLPPLSLPFSLLLYLLCPFFSFCYLQSLSSFVSHPILLLFIGI